MKRYQNLILALVSTAFAVGCSKNEDKAPSVHVETEAEEEAKITQSQFTISGRSIEADPATIGLLSRKQGKIWQREANLSAGQKVLAKAFVNQFDPLSFAIENAADGSFSIRFKVGTRYATDDDMTYTATREINVALLSSAPGILTGKSPFDGAQIVVTCTGAAPGAFCDPKASSIIEIKNVAAPLAGKVMIAAFYYSTTTGRVQKKENFPEDLAIGDTARLTSVVNVNDSLAYAKLELPNSKNLDVTLAGRKTDTGNGDLRLQSTSPELSGFRVNSFSVSDDGKQATIGIYNGEINFKREYYQGELKIDLPKPWRFPQR